jgi:hypothetical protein
VSLEEVVDVLVVGQVARLFVGVQRGEIVEIEGTVLSDEVMIEKNPAAAVKVSDVTRLAADCHIQTKF